MRSFIPYLAILEFAAVTYALRVPFQVHTSNASPGLGRRTPIPVINTGNAQYSANMTIGGAQIRVLLDTGSSDLWVNFPGLIPSTTDLGKTVTLDYAIGKASGNVHAAQVKFGNSSLDNQAFVLVTDTSTFTTNVHAQGYDGLFGLGNNDGSIIHKKLGDPTGTTFLDRVFTQNKETGNYITFMLDRHYDPAETLHGQLTISELIPGFENITSAPELDVDKVNRLLKGDQHWQAFTDKNSGIIGPDSQPIQISSINPSAPSGELVAVFDSGFTFSQVPRDVSDAIYGRVQGAQYDEQHQYWTIPCGQYLNISFNFGGVNYPIHPLDTVDNNFHITDSNGNPVCIGAFQPITSAFSMLGHYDMILGMNFLRNVYTLLDYGDWTGSNSRSMPYIQLMSMTNVQQAQQDFVQVRLGGPSTLDDPRWVLLPPSQMQHSPVSEAEKKRRYQEMILSRWPYIFTACFVLILLTIGVCIWKCCCRRGKDGRRCICCAGRNKRGPPEKDILALPNANREMSHSATKVEAPDAIYVPLGDRGYGYGQMDKPVPALGDHERRYSASSIAKVRPPPVTYGTEYENRGPSVPPHPGPYGSHNGGFSPYSSQVQMVDQEQRQPFAHGYPPGLDSQGYDAPYDHPPNYGYQAQSRPGHL